MADTPQKDRDAGLPRTRQGGRFVTRYDPEIALKICERVAEGETLSGICEEPDMPHRQTFRRWVVNQPDVSRAYAAARELSAHSLEEEAVEMARELKRREVPKDQIRALDVAMQQLRWSAAKRNPSVYSEKAAINFQVPIQINTSLDLGAGESQGAPDHPDVYTIDITAKVDIPLDEPEVKHENYAADMAEKGGDEPLVPQGHQKKKKGEKPK